MGIIKLFCDVILRRLQSHYFAGTGLHYALEYGYKTDTNWETDVFSLLAKIMLLSWSIVWSVYN